MVEEIKTTNLVTSIITLVLFLASLVLAFVGFLEVKYGLGIVSILISIILGYFVWNDYNKYIRKD